MILPQKLVTMFHSGDQIMRKSLLFLLLPLFLLTSCAALFQPKVAMNNISNGSLSGLLSEKEEITKLASPAQIFASQGMYSDRIQIAWQPVDNAVSYSLERAVQTPDDPGYSTNTPPDTFDIINASVYGTSYTDTILENPGTNNTEYRYKYWYRVYAENNREKYDPSDPATTVTPGTLFAPPQNVIADKGTSSDNITVKWEYSANASSYIVYRSTNENGAGAQEIARVTGNQNWYDNGILTSEQGNDFYYIVQAVNSKSGQTSASSNIALGYSAVEGAPPAPGAVTVTTRGTAVDGISLSWNAVSSAEGEVKYALFRYSSEDAALTQLTGETSETSWTDKNNVKTGIYYYYQVQAWTTDVTGQKLKSPLSPVQAFTGSNASSSEGFILSPPTGISVDASDSGHTVSWTAAIGHETEQAQYAYEILGSNTKDSGFVQIGTTGTGGTEYTVTGTTYKFYRVKTQYASLSSTESGTVAPAPFAAEKIAVTRAENLGDALMYPANSSGVYPVKITWTPPSQGEAAGYHVYRSNSANSGFRKITETPLTECEYVDINETAKAGKYYYYRVLAVNELDQGKNYSETKYGYGALTHEQYILEYNKTILSSQKKLTLMHKGGLDAVGSETKYADIQVNSQTGSVAYSASGGLSGASVTMKYTNYCDFTNEYGDYYFILNGNADTEITNVASQNGNMKGTMTCTGMYPGKIYYEEIKIKGGSAGGGSYGVEPDGFNRQDIGYSILN